MAIQIRCINKENRNNVYERITHIGWTNPSWTKWKLTQLQAIENIENWKYSFYVDVKNEKVNVIVSKSRFWHKYIKTENDWDEPNNLLSLPECK